MTKQELLSMCGKPGQIPNVPLAVGADYFENAIREFGVIDACEWFGHASDSDFTAETIKELLKRSGISVQIACND